MRDIGDKILKLNFGLKILLNCEYLYKIWIFYMNKYFIYVKYLYLDFYLQLYMELK